MRRPLGVLIFLICGFLQALQAQPLRPQDYIYPLRDVRGLHSASFGEMRPNHFHSGIDIKTDGVEGKEAVAVAKGYVSRVQVNPSGFGRAIYLTLDNGTTAVYGHMSRFRDDIEEYVRKEQQNQRKNKINLTLPRFLFPVAQGELIAYSGNAGISYGPHLHFELRKTSSQRTLNILRHGIFRPQDDIPPYILGIHYIETDTVRGVPVHRAPVSYETAKIDSATFRLTRHDPIEIGSNGYFVVETTDRRNGVSNSFGIYRASLYAENRLLFEYRMDGFTFNHSRDCNAASYYPFQLATKNETIRLAAIDDACMEFYPIHSKRGAITASAGELHTLRIEVEDDCGNTSRIEFTAYGRAPWRAPDTPEAILCDRKNTTTLTTGEALLTIPANALYESLLLTIGHSQHTPSSKFKMPILSSVYRLLDRTTPLKKGVDVTITANIPEALRPYATLARLHPSGQVTHVGGRYKEGGVTARTTTMGELLIVADTVPPSIKPLFAPEADLSQASRLSFRIGDNFSGIASWELTIDGKWAICDRLPIKGTAFHLFDTPPDGRRHHATLTVRDACGNRTHWAGWYVR